MKVRATKLGFIYNKRKREGDVFELKTVRGYSKKAELRGEVIEVTPEQQFSDKWMERVSDDAKVDTIDELYDQPVAPKRRKKKADVEVESSDPDDEVI